MGFFRSLLAAHFFPAFHRGGESVKKGFSCYKKRKGGRKGGGWGEGGPVPFVYFVFFPFINKWKF